MPTAIPPKPAGLDLDALFAGVHWHQTWEIFPGVFTPGRNPVADLMRFANVPDDLTGKTVLDIGPWNGCFSFECARRGAARVLGLGPERPGNTGFDRLRTTLGLTNVEYSQASCYRLDRDQIGTFDIVLFFGVIYHLRYPLLALDQIYEVCRESLFVESFVCDNHFLLGADHKPIHLGQVHPDLPATQIWQFYPHDELNGDSSNFFGPSLAALRGAVESAGFAVSHTQTWGHRAALAATRQKRPLNEQNTYERFPAVAQSVNIKL